MLKSVCCKYISEDILCTKYDCQECRICSNQPQEQPSSVHPTNSKKRRFQAGGFCNKTWDYGHNTKVDFKEKHEFQPEIAILRSAGTRESELFLFI